MDIHQTFTAIVRAISGVARIDTAEKAAIDKVRAVLAESEETSKGRKYRSGFDRKEKGGDEG